MAREMRHGLVTVMKGAVGEFTIPAMYRHVFRTEFVAEVEDAVGAGFGGVEVVLGAFEGSKFFKGEIFWEAFDRKAGKIVGHSIESWGDALRVFICVWDDAD